MELVLEIGLLIMLAGVGAFIAKLLKQPLIPAYVLSGVIISNVMVLDTNSDMVKIMSEIGIAFLLFMVGLELHLKKLKDLGLVSTVAGAAQIILTFLVGAGAASLLGMEKSTAVYIGIVVALSSTMVVVKILSDRRELSTLHGRLVIGILVIQDIFAVIALSYLSTAGDAFSLLFIPKIALVAVVGILLSKYVFPQVFEFAARSQELLLALALSVCFTFALLASLAGTSIAIGAFFAGVLLANLPYNIEIVGKVTTLRDFFSILFFTALGLQLNLEGITPLILPTIVLALLVILFKPLIIFIIFSAIRYTPRTTFLTSISLAQVSEFSLILVFAGISSGVLPQSIMKITLMLAVITMTSTSYFLMFENKLYKGFKKILHLFGVKLRRVSKNEEKKIESDVILCGYDRIGYSILKTLDKKRKVVVVDYNPDVIKKLMKEDIMCLYGDISDPEILNRLDIKKVKLAISTANKFEDNLLFLKRIKTENNYAAAIVTAQRIDDALALYENGADYVILPHFLGGEMVSTILPQFETDQIKMSVHKYKHISELMARKGMGHEHPSRN